ASVLSLLLPPPLPTPQRRVQPWPRALPSVQGVTDRTAARDRAVAGRPGRPHDPTDRRPHWPVPATPVWLESRTRHATEHERRQRSQVATPRRTRRQSSTLQLTGERSLADQGRRQGGTQQGQATGLPLLWYDERLRLGALQVSEHPAEVTRK